MNKFKGLPALVMLVLVLFLLPVSANAEEHPYSLKVCGIEIKGSDLDQYIEKDISTYQGSGAQSGTFTWEPSSNTLTLNNIQASNGSIQIWVNGSQTAGTVTIRYEGINTLTTLGNQHTISINDGTLKVVGGDHAKLTISTKGTTYSALTSALGNLVLEGGKVHSDSFLYAQNIAVNDCDLTVDLADDKQGPALWTRNGDFNITDSNLTVLCMDEDSYVLYANGNLNVKDSTLHVNTKQYTPVLYIIGNTDIRGSSLTSFGTDTILYCLGSASLQDTKLDLKCTKDTALFSKYDMYLNNVSGSINIGKEGLHPITSKGNLTIEGSGTDLKTVSPLPLTCFGHLTVNDGSLNVKTEKVAISGNAGISLNGGHIRAKSETEAVLFASNGTILLNTDDIVLFSNSNIPVIIGRTKNTSGNEGLIPEDRILFGPNLCVPKAVVRTTVWMQDSNGNLVADSVLVPANTPVNADGLIDDRGAALTGKIVVRDKTKSIPETGDHSQPMLMVLLCAAAISIAAMVMKKKAHHSAR